MQLNILDELIIDNFAGGGGASTGIELATGRPVDIAVNHDPDAIAMHKANHPYTKHFCESVWDIDPRKVCKGRKVGLAWFSPDCKHFSKAKGGAPVSKNIRGLAWVAVRWAATVGPRVIILENVEEFKTWGPVVGGKPDPKRKGKTFKSFVNALKHYGYNVEWKELKACDYGAPTIRKRFFLIARNDGKPIIWPEPTHGNGKGLKPYRTAAEIIDFSLPCPSIFDTAEEIKEKYGIQAKRPLADNTLKRIARGIQKFVIDNPEPFIVKVNHGNDNFRGQDINEPLQTVTAKHGYGIVTPYITKFQQNSTGQVPDMHIDTVMPGAARFGLIAPVVTAIGHSGFTDDRSRHIESPLNTTVSKAEQLLICPSLIQYHGEQSEAETRGQHIDRPMLTIDAAPRYGLITSHLCVLRNNQDGKPLAEPIPTIMTSPGHFAEVRAFLIKYYGQGTGQKLNEPLDTIVSRDRFGLITIKGTDYIIQDIGMRMLTPRELYNAQGFPADYIIDHDHTGKEYPKSKQVARCGNAVPPPFAEALVRANLPELCGKSIETMQELENVMIGG